MRSTRGGGSVAPSQMSGAQNHYGADPRHSYAAARGGTSTNGRGQEERRGYVDPYAAAPNYKGDSRFASSSSSGSSSSLSEEEEVGKKLVVQYSLVRDPKSENHGGNMPAYSDAYGAPMIQDEVKVKARVEVSYACVYLSALDRVSHDYFRTFPTNSSRIVSSFH